jgi:hypothetical protein
MIDRMSAGACDDHAARQATRNQEQHRRQRARLQIEAPFEVLVGRIDPGAPEERHDGHRQNDHRDGQAEVELHESQPVGVALAGRAGHRDGTELRRHHRQANGPPRQAPAGEQVAFHLVCAAAHAKAVRDDPGEIGRDDEPVDGAH